VLERVAFSAKPLNQPASRRQSTPQKTWQSALRSPRLGEVELLRRLADPRYAYVLGKGSYAEVKALRRSGLSRLCFRRELEESSGSPASPDLSKADLVRCPEAVLPFAEIGPYRVMRRILGKSPFHSQELGGVMYTLTQLAKVFSGNLSRVLPELRQATKSDNTDGVKALVGATLACSESKLKEAVRKQETFEPAYLYYLRQVTQLPNSAFDGMGKALARLEQHRLFGDFRHPHNLRWSSKLGMFRLFDIGQLRPQETTEGAALAWGHSPMGFELALRGDGVVKHPEHRLSNFVWTQDGRAELQGVMNDLKSRMLVLEDVYWKTLGRAKPTVTVWE
jgi:hypothetical protein